MFIEKKDKEIKCEPIDNGKFRITTTEIEEMDAEMLLDQMKNIQIALDNEKYHQQIFPAKLANDFALMDKSIKSQQQSLDEFKKQESTAKALMPKEEIMKDEGIKEVVMTIGD